MLCVFKLSVSSWFNFGGLYVSRNMFLLDCWICWHIIVHDILPYIFLIYALFIINSFSFLILFGFSPFSSCEPSQRYVASVYAFKESGLGLIDLFSCFSNLYFIYLLSDCLLFPSCLFRLCLFLFSNSFRC